MITRRDLFVELIAMAGTAGEMCIRDRDRDQESGIRRLEDEAGDLCAGDFAGVDRGRGHESGGEAIRRSGYRRMRQTCQMA